MKKEEVTGEEERGRKRCRMGEDGYNQSTVYSSIQMWMCKPLKIDNML